MRSQEFHRVADNVADERVRFAEFNGPILSSYAQARFREVWQRLGAIASARPEHSLMCIVACGDLPTAATNGFVELLPLTASLEDLEVAVRRLRTHATVLFSNELRMRREDSESEGDLWLDAMRNRIVNLMVFDGREGANARLDSASLLAVARGLGAMQNGHEFVDATAAEHSGDGWPVLCEPAFDDRNEPGSRCWQ